MYALTGINKLHAAHRQLNTAIRLHFENGDPVAVCALVSGAYRIFSDLAERQGTQSWDRIAQEANGLDARTYYRILRKDWNFLKHAESDPDELMDLHVGEVEDRIFLATLNAGPLDGISASEQVFQLWYVATRSESFASELVVAADELFPGIRDMTPEKRLAFGARALNRAYGGGK